MAQAHQLAFWHPSGLARNYSDGDTRGSIQRWMMRGRGSSSKPCGCIHNKRRLASLACRGTAAHAWAWPCFLVTHDPRLWSFHSSFIFSRTRRPRLRPLAPVPVPLPNQAEPKPSGGLQPTVALPTSRPKKKKKNSYSCRSRRDDEWRRGGHLVLCESVVREASTKSLGSLTLRLSSTLPVPD